MSNIPSPATGAPAPVVPAPPTPYTPSFEVLVGVSIAIKTASEGRRHSLRGKSLVGIARKAGLEWADTGTGFAPGRKLLASDESRYIVGPSGSFINIDKHLSPKLSKKQRARAGRLQKKSLAAQ